MLGVALAMLSVPSLAQSVRASHVFLVSSDETGAPLQGAEVRDSVSGAHGVTGDDGRVTLREMIPAGPVYLIEVRKVGFQPLRMRVPASDLDADGAIVLAALVAATPGVTTLPTLVTTAEATIPRSKAMQGFDARRKSVALRGKFVSPEELRAKFAGADINEVFLVKGTIPIARGCSVVYFVNGVRWSAGRSGQRPDGIPAQANAYEAIEFYPSAYMAPADVIGEMIFSHTCGIYVLWLREPGL
jgi:hypothetical protein